MLLLFELNEDVLMCSGIIFFSRPVLFLWNINVQSDDERVMDVMKFPPLLSVMILYQRFYGCDKMTLVMIAILIINGDIYYWNSKWWS